jgi:hypothetical protein
MEELKLLLLNPAKLIKGVADESIKNNSLFIIIIFTFAYVFIQASNFDYSSIMALLKIIAIFVVSLIMVVVLVMLRSLIINWISSMFNKKDATKSLRFAVSYSIFPLIFALLIQYFFPENYVTLAILALLVGWSYLILIIMLITVKPTNIWQSLLSVLASDLVLLLPMVLLGSLFMQ